MVREPQCDLVERTFSKRDLPVVDEFVLASHPRFGLGALRADSRPL